jgi:AmiR/NasT family two-component response regulator
LLETRNRVIRRMSVEHPHAPQQSAEALGPREVIGRAVGVLMSRHDLDEAAAFELLVQGSVDSRQKVREVAATIVRQSGPSADS